MKLFTFTFVSFFAISGFIRVINGEKPLIISPKGDETFIEVGDGLKIVCKGEGELKFTRHELSGNNKYSKGTTLTNDTVKTITLTINETVAEDAGWFACSQSNISVKNDEATIDRPQKYISWIYVWIRRDNEDENKFSVTDEENTPVVNALVGRDVVIPCRPSSRDTRVTMLIGNDPTEIKNDTDNIYDPKIGYIRKNVDASDQDYVVRCIADGNTDEEIPAYEVKTLHPLEDLLSHKIETEPIIHVVWGTNATLQCNITTSMAHHVDWKWTVPDSVPNDRWTHSEEKVVDDYTMHKTFVTSLTIMGVEKSYDGNYSCIAHGFGGDSYRSETYNVDIYDPNSTYIQVDNNYNGTISVKVGDPASWKFHINTWPKAVVKWYKDTTDLEKKTGYSHIADGFEHFFYINKTDIDDNGNYMVKIKTSESEKVVELELIVQGKPNVEPIRNSVLYYVPGDAADISCIGKGSPIPNATFTFSKSTNQPDEDSNSTNTLPDKSDSNNDEFTRTADYREKIHSMGTLTCKMCNHFGCDEASTEIIVSDGNGFFGVVEPVSVVEGDNLRLICAASVYNYTKEIEWTEKDSEKLQAKLPNRMNITQSSTHFTHQSILEIRNLRMSDTGNYSCEVSSGENSSEIVYHYLQVIKMKRPTIDGSITKTQDLQINPDKYNGTSIPLICQADGQPKPEITWWKGGVKLENKTNQYQVSSDRFTFDILTRYPLESHGGEYKCVAKSRVGKAEKIYNVAVIGKKDYSTVWISLVCVLILIIIVVITFMYLKIRREMVMRKELFEAGLTHFIDGAVECLNPDLPVDDQAELLPYDKKWEFPREKLKLGKQLGSGAFGVVMKATAHGICVEEEATTVAVKMVRRSADPCYMKALSSELKIMIHLGRHLNVVNLLGACTAEIFTKRELYVIVEYCQFGNVHNYLQRHRETFIDQIDSVTQRIDSNIGMERLIRRESNATQNRMKYAELQFSRSISVESSHSNGGAELVSDGEVTDFVDVSMSPEGVVLSNNSVQPGWRSNYRGDYKDKNLKPICTQDLLCWAWQASRGMEYLSSRNILHGDLAARNILLAEDNIVKICDFGLAKNMYKDNNYKKQGDGPLPIKWMAIESIRDRIFSTQSDIWSFGIVLWEFFTLARTPYPGMEAEKQYDKLIEGYRMEKPEYATDEIYDFMLQCWKAKPSLRPTFPELAERMGTLLNESVKLHIFDLNSPYMEMNIADMENGKSDYLTMLTSPNLDELPDPDEHHYLNSTSQLPLPDGSNSTYLAMSPIKSTANAGIFSPRVNSQELHFKFPIPENTDCQTNSSCKDPVESVGKSSTETKDKNSTEIKPDEVILLNAKKDQNSIVAFDSGYGNVNIIPTLSNNPEERQSFVNDKSTEIKSQNNKNRRLSTPVIEVELNNYVNMPRNKIISGDKETPANSISNPSYIGVPSFAEVK